MAEVGVLYSKWEHGGISLSAWEGNTRFIGLKGYGSTLPLGR